MDAIQQLRDRAASKRDAAVRAARNEYAASMRLIEQLGRALVIDAPRPVRKAGQPIIEMIADLMPNDDTFSIDDMVALLQEAEPGREFNVATIRSFFTRLGEQGLIRRVDKTKGGRVLWAAAGSTVKDSPFGAKPLSDVAEQLLQHSGPLTAAEIVVALQERGYRPDATARALVGALRVVLNRNRGRFERGECGRWGVLH